MKNFGQSLFEVVFSVAIAAILVVGVVALAATSVRNSTSARNDSLAKNYAEEAGEWLREERDKEWVAFKVNVDNSTKWCLKDLSWSDNSACSSSDFITSTIFIRDVIFSVINDNLIEVTIVVSWNDSQGAHEVRTVTRLANWRI